MARQAVNARQMRILMAAQAVGVVAAMSRGPVLLVAIQAHCTRWISAVNGLVAQQACSMIAGRVIPTGVVVLRRMRMTVGAAGIAATTVARAAIPIAATAVSTTAGGNL
jgi:hypothetical protein